MIVIYCILLIPTLIAIWVLYILLNIIFDIHNTAYTKELTLQGYNYYKADGFFVVDIYEGDIVHFNVRGDKLIPETKPYYNEKGTVEISFGSIGFGGWDSAYCTDVVVVGNIYQA